MSRSTLAALLAAAAFNACATATPEQRIVNDAAAALGGRDRLLAVKTLVLEGGGTNGNLLQDMKPDASGQTFLVSDYRRTIDIDGRRARTEQTRTPTFAYFQGMAPQRQVSGIDREIAYNVAANGTATRGSNTAASDRRAELLHHPITIVRAALDPAATLTHARTVGGERLVDVTIAGGSTCSLAIDAATGLPTRVVSMTDNANLGDVSVETSFADYQDVAGVKLPARLTMKTDKYTTATLQLTQQRMNVDTGDLAAPPAAASAAPIAGPPPPVVTVAEIAQGIWLLAGQSHNSVLVEFDDHLMLIEAPQSEARTLAVIAAANNLHRGKPLTQLMSTHFHSDHTGGLRAAVAEGLTVITHEGNAAFYGDAVRRPHTLAPDALARTPKPLKLEAVGDAREIADRTMTVELYHLARNPHADTLLIAYFPKQRLLVEADAFSPGSATQPYAANLLEHIATRRLKVDRVVPLHGVVTPFSEVVRAVP
jgi:glyoxylase-like metal-dependent hydrolase (beta-lactamase superfamily II)